MSDESACVRLVFMGPPGAGKGTQAIRLAEERGFAHISTGAMLREAVASGSELGKQVAPIIESGEYVTDELMGRLIQERIARADCRTGFILDGFPRTVAQAELLEEVLGDTPLSGVVLFTVSPEAVKQRLENRRSEEARADDSVEVQLRRLEVYKEKTAPLIDFYHGKGSIIEVDGDGSIEDVYGNLLTALGDI